VGPGGQSLVPVSHSFGWTVSLCDQMVGFWGQIGLDGQRLGPGSRYQEPDSQSLKLQSRSLGGCTLAVGFWARWSISWAGQLKYCCYITSSTSF